MINKRQKNSHEGRATASLLCALISLLSVSLGGCAQMVTSYIEARSISPEDATNASKEVLAEMSKGGFSGFSSEEYCPEGSLPCLRYLKAGAAPISEIEELAYDFKLQNLAAAAGERISLQLSRKDSAPFQGLVVLLHGFRAAKEDMLATAIYFRFLGFDVLAPDLLGHGESEGRLGFGITDGEYLNELLDAQAGPSRPIFLVGNSMGALAALELTKHRTDITGVILQAPMLPFDEAAVRIARQFSPLRSALIPDNSIRQGAITALEHRGLTIADTDIRPALTKSAVPILLLASPDDTVSPLSYFSDIQGPQLSVVQIPERSHFGMALIGQQQHATIHAWLQTTREHPEQQPN
ncbi:alpha/beta fold hydrolase [Microbulbifer bruguierae]|uniref:Alpha/beta fold hydrolase n=1 Tax=Microbulbifer bruguierae TaxID=3029061 RepID=A0ABY8NDI5_9GAMM|nr:alpha/beta fold hydrolase [Microbulbifer bruguierae]WGL16981.1 alpha/beta fold hydrolase [Microbulbifer bruguierae]